MQIDSLRKISMKREAGAMSMSAQRAVTVLVAILVVIFCGGAQLAHALDPIPAHIMSGLQTGVVTSVEPRSLFINGKEYMVDPDVEIRDQEDNVFPPEVVKRDQEVKFHLKKGAGNTIDFLIVYLPQ